MPSVWGVVVEVVVSVGMGSGVQEERGAAHFFVHQGPLKETWEECGN